MNMLLWTLQVFLGLYNLVGGVYSAFHFEQLKSQMANDLPAPAWAAIGILQAVFAIGLFIPQFAPVSAIYLAINALLGCFLFAAYSGFPGILWALIPAALCAFVAYGRWNK
jgi:uncharacterized membrane protein YphA (DoxX/SURF4 family)